MTFPRISLLQLAIRFSLCFLCVYGYVGHINSEHFTTLIGDLRGGKFAVHLYPFPFHVVLDCVGCDRYHLDTNNGHNR